MILTKAEINSETAMQIAQKTIAYANEHHLHICVAVVDTHGSALALWRMDNVAAAIVDFALDKAYTASTMKSTTKSYAERLNASDSLRLGLSTRSRLLPWGGGVPIYYEGTLIGAIGVSGAKEFEDIECAEAGIQQSGLTWEAAL